MTEYSYRRAAGVQFVTLQKRVSSNTCPFLNIYSLAKYFRTASLQKKKHREKLFAGNNLGNITGGIKVISQTLQEKISLC